MTECKCKFYEIDLDAKAEAEAWAAGISADEIAMMEACFYETNEEDTDPVAQCGEFCKHLCSGKGHPGEFVNFCNAPGNEHIISVDFNEAEII